MAINGHHLFVCARNGKLETRINYDGGCEIDKFYDGSNLTEPKATNLLVFSLLVGSKR
jgi:hypothetical protein